RFESCPRYLHYRRPLGSLLRGRRYQVHSSLGQVAVGRSDHAQRLADEQSTQPLAGVLRIATQELPRGARRAA
ncbi:MAG: hypothetical protein ACRDHY_16860, partial [Anaerolineales bacterium]